MANPKKPDAYSQIQKDMGARLRWARELVEPNRAAFARLVGVDRSTIQKIEEGDRALSIFNLYEICDRLQISPQYLMYGVLSGVEYELAIQLRERHPDLRGYHTPDGLPRDALASQDSARTATHGDTSEAPKTPNQLCQ